MGKIAFVFSGQGAQYSGMGKDLYDNTPSAKSVFDKLDLIRPNTSSQCFIGSKEELSVTANTQPCMFAVELAAAESLETSGVKCDMTAGFSLGEIAALTYSNSVALEDGFKIVCLRGKYMQEASEKVSGGMVAVLMLSSDVVEQLCSNYENVYPVNYNCPGQISVAGLNEELEQFTADVKKAGGRSIKIKVNGIFHSPFMKEASVQFRTEIDRFNINDSDIPMYSDYTSKPYSGEYKDLLENQICNPVRWQTLIENMIDDGADTFIEIGPGKTLCGLIKKINKDVRIFNVEDSESLKKTVEEVL